MIFKIKIYSFLDLKYSKSDYNGNTEYLKTIEELPNENFELKSRLNEPEDTLFAIQNGEIDAIVSPQGDPMGLKFTH